jgi:hypothetical protein
VHLVDLEMHLGGSWWILTWILVDLGGSWRGSWWILKWILVDLEVDLEAVLGGS